MKKWLLTGILLGTAAIAGDLTQLYQDPGSTRLNGIQALEFKVGGKGNTNSSSNNGGIIIEMLKWDYNKYFWHADKVQFYDLQTGNILNATRSNYCYYDTCTYKVTDSSGYKYTIEVNMNIVDCDWTQRNISVTAYDPQNNPIAVFIPGYQLTIKQLYYSVGYFSGPAGNKYTVIPTEAPGTTTLIYAVAYDVGSCY